MTDYSALGDFVVEVRDDGVALAEIQWTGKMTALAHHAALPKLLRELAKDDSVRVAVLTGMDTGGRYVDVVTSVNEDPAKLPELLDDARALVYAQIEMDKPVVSALARSVPGSILSMVLLSDFIVLERGTNLRDGHVAGGLTAGDGGVLTWPFALGMVRAKKYLLTSDPLSAEEAERLGLVTEVVEKGQSTARALQIAEQLAGMNQQALRYTKRALNQILRQQALTAFDYSLALEMVTLITPAVRELRPIRDAAHAAMREDVTS